VNFYSAVIFDEAQLSKFVHEETYARARRADPESVGLIATELVMNALKHAFPDQNMKGRINVAYDVDGTNWKLSVADNGIGKPDRTSTPKLKLWPGLMARPCQSRTPLFRQQ
jgi:two-component sensor histidine kinase